jgi:hypothetical protein
MKPRARRWVIAFLLLSLFKYAQKPGSRLTNQKVIDLAPLEFSHCFSDRLSPLRGNNVPISGHAADGRQRAGSKSGCAVQLLGPDLRKAAPAGSDVTRHISVLKASALCPYVHGSTVQAGSESVTPKWQWISQLPDFEVKENLIAT